MPSRCIPPALSPSFGRHSPDDTVLCVDSGAHRAWFASIGISGRKAPTSPLTNLGPMGGGIPLGIGVQVAAHQPVLVATGDGCMLMHGMELHTAAREGIPIIVAVMNNAAYGNIYYRAQPMGPGPTRLTDIPVWTGWRSPIQWARLASGSTNPGISLPPSAAPSRRRVPTCWICTSTRHTRHRSARGVNASASGRTTTDGAIAGSD